MEELKRATVQLGSSMAVKLHSCEEAPLDSSALRRKGKSALSVFKFLTNISFDAHKTKNALFIFLISHMWKLNFWDINKWLIQSYTASKKWAEIQIQVV